LHIHEHAHTCIHKYLYHLFFRDKR
jgi:hypothetical protein